jgi:transaldolase / glucose-6-phosphate isomerase
MPIQKLYSLGQSLWYDNIQRRLLENGELAGLIKSGDIRGVTSNPSIFLNAIAKTNDYEPALVPLAWSGWDSEQIFWQLAVEDIRDACDLFATLYRESEGADGYVSLEVNPTLAHDTAGTLAQAKKLWEWVDRPNLMVKIPATREGIPAVRAAIAAGINVNITLIFSRERYSAVMEAYLDGLDDRLRLGLNVRQIASVASFFVSRMDTKVDARLDALGSEVAKGLRGKAAIAYTKLAYEDFRKIFRGDTFARYAAAGCSVQRPLWASTSTKNPAYRDTMYVEELIGPGTVNTVPPQTLKAFREHGKAAITILDDLDGARQTLASLEALGISMDQVTAELEAEGVKSFSDAFSAMLAAIEERRVIAVSALGPLAASVKSRVDSLVAQAAPARLWSHDASLWTADPDGQTEARKRLGWLDLPYSSRAAVKEINDFVAGVRAEGLTHVLLLGMGGSSLAPEVLALVHSHLAQPENATNGFTFSILDSTDPDQVLATAAQFPPEKTLYIVSSKSGGTAEVNAMFNYFWQQASGNGKHFVAITDPGTSLEALAKARGFRKTFLADPTVGGRFSALSHFGLVPAVLIGYDADGLLQRAAWMMRQCAADGSATRNPGLVLGAILGQAALDGRNKLTILADESVAPLGAWLDQLIDESSGKQGQGLLVVDGELLGPAGCYGADRIFVYLRQAGSLDGQVAGLRQAGFPALVFQVADAYDLGAEFYRWEVATAFACAVLGVNAFDQPDVQDAKTRTINKITVFNQTGKLEEGQSIWEQAGLKAYSNMQLAGSGLKESLQAFLQVAGAEKGRAYVAINAYLPRNPANAALLTRLRLAIREKTGCATTLGFGPRFLHSTGQMHKGGPASSLFLQITAEPTKDLDIPGQKMSFCVLERCQALGDYEALAVRNRRILHLHLDSTGRLAELLDALK